MLPAKPFATSRLVGGGILIGGVVVWMAWQRFAGGPSTVEASTAADDYYRTKSEVYLAPLSIADRDASIGAPSPVTTDGRAAYAPAFTLDSKSVLFSSTRDDVDRAEIYRYDIDSKKVVRLTDTRELEYTPAPLTDGAHFSAERMTAEFSSVEAGSGRRMGMVSARELWTYALDGSAARRLLANSDAIAAQRWLDSTTVAMIVRAKQHMLLVVDVRDSKIDTVLRDVASGAPGYGVPALAWNNARKTLIVARGEDTAAVLTEVSWPSRATRDLMKLPKELTSFTLIRDDVVVVAAGTRLMCWEASRASWIEIANLSDVGLGPIMHLASSADGKWLALSAVGAMPPDGARETYNAFLRSARTDDGIPRYRLPASCLTHE